MDNNIKIAEVRQNYLDKTKAYEVNKAKGKAADRLKGMSDAEKQILTGLKQLVDRSSVEKIYEMLQILNLSEK